MSRLYSLLCFFIFYSPSLLIAWQPHKPFHQMLNCNSVYYCCQAKWNIEGNNDGVSPSSVQLLAALFYRSRSQASLCGPDNLAEVQFQLRLSSPSRSSRCFEACSARTKPHWPPEPGNWWNDLPRFTKTLSERAIQRGYTLALQEGQVFHRYTPQEQKMKLQPSNLASNAITTVSISTYGEMFC